jgi:hypothetical protein
MNAIYNLRQYDPPKTIGYLMNRVRSELFAALDQELADDEILAPLGISAAQYIILSGLGFRDTDSTARLCREMAYDPGAMTRMVDRLEAKGLVRRQRCPGDRRLVNLELDEFPDDSSAWALIAPAMTQSTAPVPGMRGVNP